MGSIMLDLVEDIFQQGVQLHKSGKVEIACQLYSAVLKVHPEHPTANHSMGVLAVEVGKVQEALVFFEAALQEGRGRTRSRIWMVQKSEQRGVAIAIHRHIFKEASNLM